MPDKDDLDLLLDSALATYADPGADSGLEERMLAAVAAAQADGDIRKVSRWTSWWPAWAIALPMVASLLLWIAMSRPDHAPANPIQEANRVEEMRTPSSSVPTARRTIQHGDSTRTTARSHRAAGKAALKPCQATELTPAAASTPGNSGSCPGKTPAGSTSMQAVSTTPLPKLDVFPTPQPLTPQERSFASVATVAPVPLRQALAEAQKEDNAPVHIAAIHIPPIEAQP